MKKIIHVLIILVILVLSSCDEPLQQKTEENLTCASFIMQFDDKSSKTISPKSTLLSVTSFSIEGSGPNETSFGPVFSNKASISVDNILIGDWSIIAKAYNSNGNELSRGSVSCSLGLGENNININLNSLVGTGWVQIAIKWKPTISSDKNLKIVALFEDINGTKHEEILQVGTSESSTIMKKNLPCGSYTMTLKISDSNGVIVGCAEAVRIVSNETAIGVLNFEDVKSSLNVVIKNSVSSPIIVYATCTPKSGAYVLSAVCNSLPDGVMASSLKYRWYCDGEAVGISKDYTVAHANALHRYDVVVYSNVGGTTGSATVTINCD